MLRGEKLRLCDRISKRRVSATREFQQTLTSQTARTSMAYNLLATYLRLNAILADFSEP